MLVGLCSAFSQLVCDVYIFRSSHFRQLRTVLRRASWAKTREQLVSPAHYRYLQNTMLIQLIPQDNLYVSTSGTGKNSINSATHLHLTLNLPGMGRNPRLLTMKRLAGERFSDTKTRLAANLAKHVQRYGNSHGMVTDAISVMIVERNENTPHRALTPESTLEQALNLSESELLISGFPPPSADSSDSLKPLELRFRIRHNPPTISRLRVDQKLFTDFPVVAKISASDNCHQLWTYWFARRLESEITEDSIVPNFEDLIRPCNASPDLSPRRLELDGWTLVHCATSSPISQTFVPPSSLIGHHLCVAACPIDSAGFPGFLQVWISSQPLQQGPCQCLFDERIRHTRELAPENSCRVVSYNVLAQLYVKPGPEGYFPYCPASVIDRDYRYPVLLKEIAGYNGDIVCIQEVDVGFHMSYLEPWLMSHGYAAEFSDTFCKKSGEVNEGCAIVYRREKFKCVSHEQFVVSDLVDKFPDLKTVVDQSAAVQKLFGEKLNTILQIMVLDSPSLGRVIVANTHLFFNPRLPHVKLLQIIACLRQLQSLYSQEQDEFSKPRVIFCGDFNSTPDSGVYEYITSGDITEAHPEWSFDKTNDGEFFGASFSHSLGPLRSACGTPEFTNFTQSFEGCLDYIFVNDGWTVNKVVPMPAREDVEKHTAIPSVECPSDHLALVCELSVL